MTLLDRETFFRSLPRALAGTTIIILLFASTIGSAQVVQAQTPERQEARSQIAYATFSGRLPETRCPLADVYVTTSSNFERQLACDGARLALSLLGRCALAPRAPLLVSTVPHVRLHKDGPPVFGLFDPRGRQAVVVRWRHLASLMKNTPYDGLSLTEFFKSLVTHEVVHATIAQHQLRPFASRAAYEYPAYALQIASLSPASRRKFLDQFDPSRLERDLLFNDFVLSLDPYLFAARAYAHFTASHSRCDRFAEILRGTPSFILELP